MGCEVRERANCRDGYRDRIETDKCAADREQFGTRRDENTRWRQCDYTCERVGYQEPDEAP
eukprot:1210676-Prymnesium_polylepis.1